MEPGRIYPPPMWLVITINLLFALSAIATIVFGIYLLVR